MISRFSMLECGKNFRGTLNEKCFKTCNQVDTQEHRLNECMKYLDNNFASSDNNFLEHRIDP